MDKTKVLCEASHPCTMDRYFDTKPEQTVISVISMLAVKKKKIDEIPVWNTVHLHTYNCFYLLCWILYSPTWTTIDLLDSILET